MSLRQVLHSYRILFGFLDVHNIVKIGICGNHKRISGSTFYLGRRNGDRALLVILYTDLLYLRHNISCKLNSLAILSSNLLAAALCDCSYFYIIGLSRFQTVDQFIVFIFLNNVILYIFLEFLVSGNCDLISGCSCNPLPGNLGTIGKYIGGLGSGKLRKLGWNYSVLIIIRSVRSLRRFRSRWSLGRLCIRSFCRLCRRGFRRFWCLGRIWVLFPVCSQFNTAYQFTH